MTKDQLREIINSLIPQYDNKLIEIALSKLDSLSNEKISTILNEIRSNDEQSIKTYIQGLIEKMKKNSLMKFTPINRMFTYGVNDTDIHLHMPVDLNPIISKYGMSKTRDILNLYLLDAIERIRKLYNDGYSKFNGVSEIYMISQLLFGKREIDFLNSLDFKTQTYDVKQLQDKDFIRVNLEAKAATLFFGNNAPVGSAKIKISVINSEEWQQKRLDQVKKIAEKGITLDLIDQDQIEK